MTINTPQELCKAIETKSPNQDQDILSYIEKANIGDLNYQDKESSNKTPLIHAVLKKNFKIVDALVKKGVDQNIFDDNGKSAQGYITSYDNLEMQIKMWKVLRGEGYTEDIAISTKAAEPNQPPQKQEAKQSNAKYEDKETALIDAAKIGDVNKVKSLLKEGYDPNTQDSYGKTALMHAIENADLYYVNDPKKENVINILTEKTNLNICDNNGNTALMQAAKKNDLDTTKILIKNGADKEIINKDKKTALKLAMENKNPLLVTEITGEVGKEARSALIGRKDNINQIVENFRTQLAGMKNNNKTRVR